MHRIYALKSNECITIIVDGVHYRRNENAELLFDLAQKAKSSQKEEDYEALINKLNPIKRVEVCEFITVEEGTTNYYLGETKVPIPGILVDKIFEFLDKGYSIKPLVNFWNNCLLNTNNKARDDFFEYVEKYGVPITDKGYVVLYKAVNNKYEDKLNDDLESFVSTQWLKIKAQKKAVKNYSVYLTKDNEYKCWDTVPTKHSDSVRLIGKLTDLHENLYNAKETKIRFTPWYNGDYGMDIQLGVPVEMDRDKCDPDISNECSYGLHVGSYQYVESFGSDMDTILACLVNPKDIVAIPKYDTSKIRCCKYFPYGIMERDESGTWKELENDYFEDDYFEYEDEQLSEMLNCLYSRVEHAEASEKEKIESDIDIIRNRLNNIYE